MESRNRVTKRPRACVPCHDRKVRCDASEVGIPCSRCRTAQRTSSCVLLSRPFRHCRGPRTSPSSSSSMSPRTVPGRSDLPHIPPTSFSDPGRNATTFAIASLHAETVRRPSSVARVGDTTRYSAIHELTPETESGDKQGAEVVSEEDVSIQICCEMANPRPKTVNDTRVESLCQGREMLEYMDRMNSLTLLSNALGNDRQQKLVRVVLRDRETTPGPNHEFCGLDPVDLDYLQKRGAFTLPPRPVCEELFRLYFQCCHPYTPILDRLDFLQSFENGTASTFLMQCIFASVIPYAPLSLLNEAGFPERRAAQKGFFTRARVLYDFGVEKRQFPLLQGCLALSLVQFTFAIDKDFRFWLSTAMRLATNIGLHRKDVVNSLDRRTGRTARRMWWALYNRDVTHVFAGLDNVRRLQEGAIDSPLLTEEDFEGDDTVPERFSHILSPISDIQKRVLVAQCSLSRIAAFYIDSFNLPSARPTFAIAQNIQEDLQRWHRSLPRELQVTYVEQWDVHNMWILVLMARFYHLKCVFYRSVKNLPVDSMGDMGQRGPELLRNAMFELDNVLDRVMINNVAQSCPLFMLTCASTVLALHIEIALDPASEDRQRQNERKHFDTGLTYMRNLADRWLGISWYLRLHELILEGGNLADSSSAHLNAGLTLQEKESRPYGDSDTTQRNPAINPELSATAPATIPLFDAFVGVDVGITEDSALRQIPNLCTDDWLQDMLDTSFPL